MTDPAMNSTESLLQELIKTVSTLMKEVSELKKADNAGSNVNPWKWHRDIQSESQAAARDSEDDADQPSDNEERDSDPSRMQKTINLPAPLNTLSFQKRAKPFWRLFSA